MTFVILCMIPLLSPHVTFYQTHLKLAQGIREQLEADNWYATFYEDLLKGNRNWDSLPFETSQPYNEEGGTYIIEYEYEKSGAKGESYFLRMVMTTKTKRKFIYYFVVTGKTDENQKEASNAS